MADPANQTTAEADCGTFCPGCGGALWLIESPLGASGSPSPARAAALGCGIVSKQKIVGVACCGDECDKRNIERRAVQLIREHGWKSE